MNIDSIQNGVVIDHITAGQAMRLYELLHLGELDCQVAIIKNAQSKNGKRKDIIKIDAVIDLDFDVIGYVDPGATVNRIKDRQVIEKLHLQLPEKLTNVIKCKNPRCITSCEQELKHVFVLTDRDSKTYRCLYCETKSN